MKEGIYRLIACAVIYFSFSANLSAGLGGLPSLRLEAGEVYEIYDTIEHDNYPVYLDVQQDDIYDNCKKGDAFPSVPPRPMVNIV